MAASQHCHKHTVQLCCLAREAAGWRDAAASGFFFSSFISPSHKTDKENKNIVFFFAEDCTTPQAVAVYCYPSYFAPVKDDIATASEFDINVRFSFF